MPDPPAGNGLIEAVKSTLSLLDLGPDHVMAPVLGALFRLVLGPADLSLALIGRTGVFKSEVAALVQQHFGTTFDARHLPGSWSSTANALERLAFDAKDALLVVDDFNPHGTANDIARCHRDADRIVRAQGNRSGRSRLRPDGELRPVRAPRGLIMITGEDMPRGSSLRARLFVVEIETGDITSDRLSKAQEAAAGGLYCQSIAAYLQWLAPQYEKVREHLQSEVARLRQEATRSGQHRRTPDIVANLNHRAQFRATDPSLWGWRLVHFGREQSEWRPQGKQVGWVDGDDLYVDPTAAHRVVQTMSGPSDSVGVNEQTLRKRLREAGFLASVDEGRGKVLVRRTLQGRRRDVLHFRTGIFGERGRPETEQPDGLVSQERDDGPIPWAGNSEPNVKSAHETPPSRPQEDRIGPIGPVPGAYRAEVLPTAAAVNTGASQNQDRWKDV